MSAIDISFRALERWPKEPTRSRRRATFKSTYSQTVRLLESELSALKVREAVIEADCDRSQIRLDGRLRSDAKLRGPGIVLHFETKQGAMTFPCDTFADWPDNLRAIALTLEALRKINRYGVTANNEQYRGWAALPDHSGAAFSDVAAAAQWLREMLIVACIPPSNDNERNMIRREAIPLFHPDRNDGDHSLWNKWQEAAKLLGIEV